MTSPQLLQRTFGLRGRVAVITGASAGLGAHFARVLAEAGCSVVLTARRAEKLADQVAAIQAAGGDALGIPMDVTVRDSVEDGFAQISAKFPRLDILINNAGIAAPEPFLEMREEAWQQVLETDLSAVWRVGQVAARQMVQHQSARQSSDQSAARSTASIINVASILGLAAQRNQSNYTAAKAGVIQLTQTMALELTRHGVRVNALAPGYFLTDLNRKFLQSSRGKTYLATLPPKRAGELAELNGALLLLASDAGSYINGSTIVVDGGSLLGGM